MEETAYRDRIRQLFASSDPVNSLIALQIIEGNPWLKEELKHVTTLDLSGLFLDSIPPMVFACKHLKELDLSTNNITEIPRKIKKLKALKGLNIADNSFTVFPYAVVTMSLKYLDIRRNQIGRLPQEMMNVFMRMLKKVELRGQGNPLTDMEKVEGNAVMEAHYVQLMSYYSEDSDLHFPGYLHKRVFWRMFSLDYPGMFVSSLILSVVLFPVLLVFFKPYVALGIAGAVFLVMAALLAGAYLQVLAWRFKDYSLFGKLK